jgi:hypothetical protein
VQYHPNKYNKKVSERFLRSHSGLVGTFFCYLTAFISAKIEAFASNSRLSFSFMNSPNSSPERGRLARLRLVKGDRCSNEVVGGKVKAKAGFAFEVDITMAATTGLRTFIFKSRSSLENFFK